jgi:hypothetical protein
MITKKFFFKKKKMFFFIMLVTDINLFLMKKITIFEAL